MNGPDDIRFEAVTLLICVLFIVSILILGGVI